MKIEVVKEDSNRLLHRTEMECKLEYDAATPTRKDLQKALAAKKGVSENLVVVDEMKQEFGKKAAKCFVKVYESEKMMNLVEQKHILERHADKKAKKAEAAK